MFLDNSLEHRLLPVPFYILTAWGVWCPAYWSSLLKRLYSVYTAFIVIAKVLFITETFIYVVTSFSEGRFELAPLFVLTSVTNSTYKVVTILYNREWIVSIVKAAFDDRWNVPRDTMEEKIMKDFRRDTR